ncbi:MAG TPA: hypothetical protein VJQ54_18755 [Candidatus Sulfotelmatobacter sp.]|nr:hypothetical protein [Candidatus Sulfotelmatobacter sp.]
MRRWSAVPVVLIVLVMLGLSLTLSSEPLRAVAVLIAAGSISYAWISLRKNLQSRTGVILLGAGLSTLALGCAWSGLNVARFYLYNPAMNQVGSYPTWFEIVSTMQVVIQWCGAVAALAFVVILAGSPLWTRFHRTPSMGKQG